MNVAQEFSRFADQYDSHNQVQRDVAQKLLKRLKKHYTTLVDIGAGSGTLYRLIAQKGIEFDTFWALDLSEAMLKRHPSHPKVIKKIFNFNQPEAFQELQIAPNATILSSSALQWASNLDVTLQSMSRHGERFYLSFFTANTFATLHKTANIHSPIYPTETILNHLNKYYTLEDYELLSYQLHFETVRQMFQHIKKSGVSGGTHQLSYRAIKRLMQEYPLNYLEFEVLLVEATPKVL